MLTLLSDITLHKTYMIMQVLVMQTFLYKNTADNLIIIK